MTDVFQALQVFLGGYYVNDFNYLGRTYRVMAQADAPFRARTSQVGEFRTRNAAGQMVPLGAVTRIRQTTGPDRVNRYDLYQSAEINGSPAPGSSSGQAIAEMEKIAKANLPPGYGYEWTELAFQEQAAGNTALLIFPLCILFVWLTHSAEYESFSLSSAIILIVPMCLLCGIAGVWASHMDNNIFTQIGFVVLAGLSAKNAVLIVEFAKQQQEQGKNAFEAAVEAARLRLRPILMTSFAFILGVVPLLRATGAGAEMRQALGTVVFYGMLGVTFFGLFLTPVFYVTIRRLTRRYGPIEHPSEVRPQADAGPSHGGGDGANGAGANGEGANGEGANGEGANGDGEHLGAGGAAAERPAAGGAGGRRVNAGSSERRPAATRPQRARARALPRPGRLRQPSEANSRVPRGVVHRARQSHPSPQIPERNRNGRITQARKPAGHRHHRRLQRDRAMHRAHGRGQGRPARPGGAQRRRARPAGTGNQRRRGRGGGRRRRRGQRGGRAADRRDGRRPLRLLRHLGQRRRRRHLRAGRGSQPRRQPPALPDQLLGPGPRLRRGRQALRLRGRGGDGNGSGYGGAIINVGSTESDRALPLHGMYSASKHAVKAFTDALRMELEEEGAPVSVTLIKPGSINTPFTEHARNYMGKEPNYPPPVYAPEVVAKAILHAAAHPVRDLFAGGGGKMISTMGQRAPRLTDRMMERSMFRQQQQDAPARGGDALHAPGDGLRERGDYPGHVMQRSLYTQATMHPLLTGAAVLGAVGLAVGLLAAQGDGAGR